MLWARGGALPGVGIPEEIPEGMPEGGGIPDRAGVLAAAGATLGVLGVEGSLKTSN